MDDMKDKFKGFMKKVNTQLSSSSSSGNFKGQGRVLGGGSAPASGPPNPIHARYSQPVNPKPNSASTSKPSPRRTPDSDQDRKPTAGNSSAAPTRKPADGFDPFDSLITTGKRSQNGYSVNVFECPICRQPYRSEEEVSAHVETCVLDNDSNIRSADANDVVDSNGVQDSSGSELEAGVGLYVSGKPPGDSVEIVLRLFRNVVKEPENAKFRRIRMGNPKIREAVTEVSGGVELLELVGFDLKEEGGEMWAVMEDVPKEEKIGLINRVIKLLEPRKVEEAVLKAQDGPSVAPIEKEEKIEPKKIDRQIRVFFSVPENVASKIELPDSFYNLSAAELKREADMRKKKIAESQLLIPKSYREKQAKAARSKYTRAVIRIQFPDGVVLQGVFAPWEPTGALYEFASSALKDPSLEFQLVHPIPVKRRVIPHFSAAGEKAPTLEDEDLVPSALIKFKPVETDSSVFTGLCNELLEISEPLN